VNLFFRREAPNKKQVTMTKIRNSIKIVLVIRTLGFGIYLGFACLPVGREFGNWDFSFKA
jgi:hypothetical protein